MSHASHESPHHEGGGASDGVNLTKVIAVGVVSLVLFAAGIGWAVSLMHSTEAEIRKAGPARVVTEAYKAEIGIVDNALFSQDHRLKAYREERKAWLNSYGWSDRKSGLIHLPIERAMAEFVAEAARPEVAPQLPPAPVVAPEPVKPSKPARVKVPVKPVTAPSAQGAPH